MKVVLGLLVVVALAAAAVVVLAGGDDATSIEPSPDVTLADSVASPAPSTTTTGPGERERRRNNVDIMPVVPGEVYDPVAAGEPTPPNFRQVLPRDSILPVYNPRFVSAVDAAWTDDALIIGLELEGEAKAYPVSFLTRREMVIDWIGGTPVLVSW